mgnify:CR=1 FL=1
MKVFFKTLNGECYEINCSSDIQLGQLFQSFSDKLAVKFLKPSEATPLKGISVAKIGDVMPMNSDIHWNNTLDELNIVGDNVTAHVVILTTYTFYWKFLLYKKGVFQYPPKHINDECPINLVKIGEHNLDISNNEKGTTNTPPNVVLVENNGHVIAFNTINLLISVRNLNIIPYFEYKLPFKSKKTLMLLTNIVDNSLKDYCNREPYLTIKLN